MDLDTYVSPVVFSLNTFRSEFYKFNIEKNNHVAQKRFQTTRSMNSELILKDKSTSLLA